MIISMLKLIQTNKYHTDNPFTGKNMTINNNPGIDPEIIF